MRLRSAKKNLQQQIKDISTQHKTLSKQRKFEEKQEARYIELAPGNFYSMFQKRAGDSVAEFYQFPEEEKAKWIAARDAYWEKAKNYFTPKPKLGANGFCKICTRKLH